MPIVHRARCPLHQTPEPFPVFRFPPPSLEGLDFWAAALSIDDAPELDEALLRAVAVCPTCGFASSEPRLFLAGEGPGEGEPDDAPWPPIPLPFEAVDRCLVSRDARAGARGLGEVEARGPREALVAWSLAIQTAEALAQGLGEAVSFPLVHASAAHVAIARLSAQLGLAAAVEGHLLRARELAARASARATGSLLVTALGREAVISARLDDAGQARRALATLRRLVGDPLVASGLDAEADPVPVGDRPRLVARLIALAERVLGPGGSA